MKTASITILRERNTAMDQKSGAKIIRYLILIGLMPLLAGCSPKMGEQSNHDSKTGNETIYATPKTEIAPSAIPPIDAAAPSAFEKASFGLG